MRRQSSCLPSQQQLSAPFLDDAVIGEVQGGHETVQPGAQWRHPDLAEPFCYTIRSGMSAAGSAHSSYGAEAAGPCPDCCWAGRAFAFCPVQVIGLCEKKRDPQPKHIIADTPGQIEIFTWSASGAIITEVPSCKHIDARSHILAQLTRPGVSGNLCILRCIAPAANHQRVLPILWWACCRRPLPRHFQRWWRMSLTHPAACSRRSS